MKDAPTINEKTNIPLKLVSGICVTAVMLSAGWYSLKADLKDIKSAQVTRGEVADWTNDLQARNPSLKVPRFSSQRPYANIETAGAEKNNP